MHQFTIRRAHTSSSNMEQSVAITKTLNTDKTGLSANARLSKTGNMCSMKLNPRKLQARRHATLSLSSRQRQTQAASRTEAMFADSELTRLREAHFDCTARVRQFHNAPTQTRTYSPWAAARILFAYFCKRTRSHPPWGTPARLHRLKCLEKLDTLETGMLFRACFSDQRRLLSVSRHYQIRQKAWRWERRTVE